MQKLFTNEVDQENLMKSEVCKPDLKRAWIEVDPKAIKSNTLKIKEQISENCLLMAVVKADGYGHGAITVAKATIKGGAHKLGVATLQEGIELREANIDCPILVLGNLIDEDELESCLKWNLMPTISDIREALICKNIAEKYKQYFKIQIKFDTGMTRLGCELSKAIKLIQEIINCNELKLDGIYSHLALADQDSDKYASLKTKDQQNKFNSILELLGKDRDSLCCHLANSAGTLRDKSFHYNMVRVGLAIYGYSPINSPSKNLKLRPALSVKAKIILIRDVPKGVGVSYGHSFTTQRPSRLAVVSIGYADGINRNLSGKISVLCKGNLLPQVGAITMDQLIIDTTDFPEIELGDIVTLLGSEGDSELTAKEWGTKTSSIIWEILCGFKHRLPRVVI